MKKTWRTLLTVLLLVCFVVCAVLMLRQFRDYRKGAESAKLAMELAAEPETVLISTGKNSYGHPSPEVLQRITDTGAEIFRTDENGTVTVRIP